VIAAVAFLLRRRRAAQPGPASPYEARHAARDVLPPGYNPDQDVSPADMTMFDLPPGMARPYVRAEKHLWVKS
jgi:hypothetical protein